MAQVKDCSSIIIKKPLISVSQWHQQEIKADIALTEKLEECKRSVEFADYFSRNDCNCSAQYVRLLKDPECPPLKYLSKLSYSELRATKTELTEQLQRLQKLQGSEELKAKNTELLFNYTDYFNNDVSSLDTFLLKPFSNWYIWVDSILDIQGYGQILYLYFISHVLVVGLTLLSVLIGVVYLTNNYKLKSIEQSSFKQLSRKSK